MTLNPHPTFPATGQYVLRLHHDTDPLGGRLSGRIQHVSSGDSVDFACGADLLEWLQRHAAQQRPSATPPSEGGA
jgi:hypothetical protein